ncbi:hypothetical protein [Dyadobacter frigoris]|uniref:Uncharacterized protein n=1 Tax=Dyadobacter frigoris TaxID=2576211 RepID=A0A4U6CQS0_9BACT|nr:hypothetical protein [Dyadobacter frigoris]TKT85995.1 hypothetical protein FDK13_32880 [Dyadobacter frigoris]
MEQKYTLAWLDFIVTVTLNASKTDLTSFSAEQSKLIVKKAVQEKEKHKTLIQDLSFGLFDRRKIQLLIKQYHGTLVVLLDKAYENVAQVDGRNTVVATTCEAVLECIHELLSFIEQRFGEYIGLDERAPAAYLSETKKDLKGRIDNLKISLVSNVGNKNLTDILLHALYNFTNEIQKRIVTFREIFYKKELVRELEKVSEITDPSRVHDAVIEQLIYLNFNSRAFMNYYTRKIAQKVNAPGPLKDKVDLLLFFYKEFNQMHRKPGIRLNPHYGDIKKVVGNWFAQEISYLEKKHQWDVSPLTSAAEHIKESKPEPFKVMCFLSVDQIGLLLRTLDGLRIVQARSLTLVFESIVPFLSTPRAPQLSAESLRNKSYNFEERDKQVVIKMLESMIEWIREYKHR